MIHVKPTECATTGCHESERWMAVREANRMGNDAPGRCASCCDAIDAHGIPPLGLVNVDQLAPWDSIPRDYRGVFDGLRKVLVSDELSAKHGGTGGTVSVPWYGPFEPLVATSDR